ncbi:MAG: filamentous hemagglutinin N-terminal domain-containing protein, partial [Burkholderiales bacterium]|nr:filamentous hemagglutinin N-terminal domain-containing protein [Burkholderiales bacterium]
MTLRPRDTAIGRAASGVRRRGDIDSMPGAVVRRDARARAPRPQRPTALAAALAGAALLSLAPPGAIAPATANPTNPSVIAGSATFQQHGKTLSIVNSPNTIIQWGGFSIRADEITRFIQQGPGSAVLNRVTGPEASQLLGQLLSNGRVFLINPNGIVVGPGATIDTAGFIASTLNMSNADFLSGRLRFEADGRPAGIANYGVIRSQGGLIALVAGAVENHGTISSPGGQVALAAGRSVEIVDVNSPNIRVRLNNVGGEAQLNRILQSGTISVSVPSGRDASAARVEGGRIVLYAAGDVTTTVTSRVAADGTRGGSVVVESAAGRVDHQGTTSARGEPGGGTAGAGPGGSVELRGDVVRVGGSISVDGATGGQVVVAARAASADGSLSAASPVGTGGSIVLQASGALNVAANARVAADGAGGGGRVLLQAGERVTVLGGVSATGTAPGDARAAGSGGTAGTAAADPNARGGDIRVLGTEVVLNEQARVDASAPAGGGQILIGGDLQGRNADVFNAQRTFLGRDVVVEASATLSGDGGRVIVWAEEATNFRASINANAGPLGGDGGFVEVSGKNALIFRGRASVDAPLGRRGTVLLDPNNIFITGGVAGSGAQDAQLADSQIQFTEGPGADSTISRGTLEALTGNIILQAEQNITLNSGVTLNLANQTAGESVTFQAGGSITISSFSSLTTGGGNIVLSARDAGAAAPNAAAAIAINGTLNAGGGTISLSNTGSGGIVSPGTISNGTIIVSGSTLSLTSTSSQLINTGFAGTVNVAATSSWAYIGGGLNLVPGAVLNLSGSTRFYGAVSNISGTGTINLSSGGLNTDVGGNTINVGSGIVINATGTSGFGAWSGTGTINSAGIVNVNGGSFTTQAGVMFANSGTMTTNAGTLSLSGAWSNSGTLTALGGLTNLGGTFSLASINGAPGGVLDRLGGAITMPGSVTGGNGTLDIGAAGPFGAGGMGTFSGRLSNLTLISSDATQLINSNGTLDNVIIGTVASPNLSVATSSNLSILGNHTIVTGGTFNAGASAMYFSAGSTITGGGTLSMSGGLMRGGLDAAGTLTLGVNTTLAGYTSLYSFNPTTFVNDGTLLANTPAQTFSIAPLRFINNGTITASAGSLSITPGLTLGSAFTNAGTVLINGGTASIDPNATFAWTNTGTLSQSAGTLNLGGRFTPAEIASGRLVRTGGSLNITGLFDGGNGTLDIHTPTFGTGGLTALNGGTLRNTTLVSTGTTQLGNTNGTLDNVTIGNVANPNLTVTGSSNLYVLGNQTITAGGTFNAGATAMYFSAGSTITGGGTLLKAGGLMRGGLDAAGTLTLGVNTTLAGYTSLYSFNPTTFVNDGTLLANTPAQTFSIAPLRFINNGTITA